MYIKLIAKPNTWFEEGTEVFWSECETVDRRPTEEEWENIKKLIYNNFRGTRISKVVGEPFPMDIRYISVEVCDYNEFSTEETEEQKVLVKVPSL